MLAPHLSTPEGWSAAAQQLMFWYAWAAAAAPQEAGSLLWQEYALALDVTMLAHLTGVGFYSTGLTADIEDLSAALVTNPLYNTPAGFALGLMSGALALSSFTPA
jgi:hypothetical protein